MIDLDEEQARMESMLDRRERMALGVTCTEMIELITRLRQAEKDAARYRWLRQQPCSGWEVDGDETSHIDVTMWRNDGFDNCNSGESLSGDQMDAAIDEAMQCSK